MYYKLSDKDLFRSLPPFPRSMYLFHIGNFANLLFCEYNENILHLAWMFFQWSQNNALFWFVCIHFKLLICEFRCYLLIFGENDFSNSSESFHKIFFLLSDKTKMCVVLNSEKKPQDYYYIHDIKARKVIFESSGSSVR